MFSIPIIILTIAAKVLSCLWSRVKVQVAPIIDEQLEKAKLRFTLWRANRDKRINPIITRPKKAWEDKKSTKEDSFSI